MGTVRLFLAFSVVIWHIGIVSPWLYMMENRTAVQSFFIISGYYMALVYPRYQSKCKFFINRFIRIYPVYAVCALFDLIIRGTDDYIELLSGLPFIAELMLIITQLLLFFHEWGLWLFIDNGQLMFGTENFTSVDFSLHSITLIRQAWSLSIELFFYLLVPYIIGQTSRIKLMFIGAIGVKMLMNYFDIITYLPFHRSLPGALPLFMLGALCYHYREHITALVQRIPPGILCTILVLYISFSGTWIKNLWVERLIFYFLLCISITHLSESYRYSKLDRWIGEISYPLCLVHNTVIDYLYPRDKDLYLAHFLSNISTSEIAWSYKWQVFKANIIIVAISLLLSVIIYYCVTYPLEFYRKRNKAREAKMKAEGV